MPELPEVETVRRGLTDRLANFQIGKVEICRDRLIASPGGPEEFVKMLSGVHVGSWARRGKYLIADLHRRSIAQAKAGNSHIHAGFWGVHLRMTGQFQWHESLTPPCPHTRVRFWNSKGNELRFVDTRSFGQMWWVPPGQKPETVITGLKKLGPEPFSKSFNANYLHKRLQGSKRSIKSALLDQSVVAGIGNIYADESLFEAGICPQTQSGLLNKPQLESLCVSLIKVLHISIGKGGTTFSDFRDLNVINGNYGGQAWVYGRAGKSCRRCNGKILKQVLVVRSTHWCPRCQQ